MKKIVLASIPLFLIGCTTLDSNSDFTDSVKRIDSKQNYQVVIGESLTPDVLEVRQGQLVNSSLELNYVKPYGTETVPDSYITMELQYFKNYNEYRTVLVKGAEDKVPLKPYAASAETCSDICTQTQYVKFPVSNEIFNEAPFKDLIFDVQVSNANSISFSIPAGYIEAIVNTGDQSDTVKPVVAAAVPVVATAAIQKKPASQALDMSKYWFEQVPLEQRDSVVNWSVANRNGVVDSLDGKTKEIEMFEYWFEKASKEERKAIIKQLLEF
ncbi:DUF2057 domain-containing protein [Vibrio tasmaniensis ZS-17]|uniref:VvgS protein n=1 Tax=Vibrio TaxID=662 RepID=UPI0002D7F35C|nr:MULTISPECIES: VvgS protein [Vibrio]MBE8567267.1 DUF2057 domain-containing protein [Vibrio sp. OPT20]OED66837.1 DUF2057 domain-containing protein [Vibrio tasmaniensis ZS-17]